MPAEYRFAKIYLEVDPVVGRVVRQRYERGEYNGRLPSPVRLEFDERGDRFYIVVVLTGSSATLTRSARKAIDEIIEEAEHDTRFARKVLRMVDEFTKASLKSFALEGVDWIW